VRRRRAYLYNKPGVLQRVGKGAWGVRAYCAEAISGFRLGAKLLNSLDAGGELLGRSVNEMDILAPA